MAAKRRRYVKRNAAFWRKRAAVTAPPKEAKKVSVKQELTEKVEKLEKEVQHWIGENAKKRVLEIENDRLRRVIVGLVTEHLKEF